MEFSPLHPDNLGNLVNPAHILVILLILLGFTGLNTKQDLQD